MLKKSDITLRDLIRAREMEKHFTAKSIQATRYHMHIKAKFMEAIDGSSDVDKEFINDDYNDTWEKEEEENQAQNPLMMKSNVHTK